MSRARGWGAAATAVLLAAVVAAMSPAAAVETPIYNEPPGGGPVTTVVEKVGPFTLDPLGGLHDQNNSAGLVPRPEGAFGLKSAFFELVDENDQPIGRHDVHMHHFVIGAVGKIDLACPDRKELGFYAQPLVGSGMEQTPIVFADPYMLPVAADDLWGAVWHLMNETNTTKTVYVKYTLGVQFGATPENSRVLQPFWADSRTCPSGAVWDVPGNGGPGAIETKTKTWAMPFDGYVVGIGGHMHDGGISMTTKHEDGTFMCENLASYYAGMLDRISPCPIHDSITKGELLSVTSRYDNSARHDDVMGMAVMYLWDGDQGTPPSSTTSTVSSTDTSGPSGTAGASSATPAASAVVAVPRFTG